MVPRTEVVAVDENIPIEEIKKIFISTGFSKIPVYKKTIDKIMGYVHVFDMMKNPESLKNILLPLAFVPESMLINDVLKLLTRQHKSISVVIDEYGGISGILTVEDIVEELFGEIEDEYDITEYVEKKINETTFEFSARLEVDYVNQKYNLSLPQSEFYETLGGLIAFNTGQIPKKDDQVKIHPYTLTIKKVSATKIEQIHLLKSELD